MKKINIKTKNYNLNKILKIDNIDHLQIINIKGPDSKKFLQNQLTININKLDNNLNFFNALHCNSQGKILTNMHIFKYSENYYKYIIQKNILKKYLEDIKKYLSFYDIKIFLHKKEKIFGLFNIKYEKFFSKFFRKNNVFSTKKTLFFYKKNIFLKFFFSKNYYFLILSKKNIQFFIQEFYPEKIIYFKKNNFWNKLYMKIGYPIIDINDNCNLFFPQQSNMISFRAIDLNKGCYLGQEIINNINFKNKKNKQLFLLEGKAKFLPSFNDVLEIKKNKFQKWKIIRGSIILKSLIIKLNLIWIQVILKNNILKNSLIRLNKDKKSIFSIIKIFE
ncbi:hypothetical protein GJU02_00895 [Enterobacteriaceae endosymbiont of Donacia thalassina]|uniref:CAF17-like 4Fe-4S cluster assembly/insertion protein YgfZ n=1 Tax=Enterobacteriaceae endosymbiont of Donacia thalassina TaxID=2675786 RepID=UPI001449D2BC|nr:hypothetical protein [Enterobacteriaceae endosymbiont of Donacia thalassina]QJC37298.1 hypothetical protein GJU02_00895 [Enterobacteriaceae endosymbiont of Donacia thalassina]